MKYAKLIYKNVIFYNIFQYLALFMYKLQKIGNFRVRKWIKGTVSQDFVPGFFIKQLLLVLLEMSKGRFKF